MIILAILGILVVFALMIFLFYRYVMKVSSIMVDSKVEDKDIIITTGRVPHSWIKADVAKAGSFTKARLMRRCLRRINRLIRYQSHTTLVSSEAERRFVIKALRDVREAWKREELEDIILPRDPFAGPYMM